MKGQVIKKEPTTSTGEPHNNTYQEFDGTYHAMVLSHFTCGGQCRMLLKSQADSILVNDRRRVHVLLWLR